MTTTFKQQAETVQKIYNDIKRRKVCKLTTAQLSALNDAASTLAALAINEAVDNSNPLVEKLAKEFSAKLQEWIGDELKIVVARNAVEKDSAVCHSHDFCDANTAMIEVFEKNSLNWEVPEHSTLLDAAWNKAKANNFYTI